MVGVEEKALKAVSWSLERSKSAESPVISGVAHPSGFRTETQAGAETSSVRTIAMRASVEGKRGIGKDGTTTGVSGIASSIARTQLVYGGRVVTGAGLSATLSPVSERCGEARLFLCVEWRAWLCDVSRETLGDSRESLCWSFTSKRQSDSTESNPDLAQR